MLALSACVFVLVTANPTLSSDSRPVSQRCTDETNLQIGRGRVTCFLSLKYENGKSGEGIAMPLECPDVKTPCISLSLSFPSLFQELTECKDAYCCYDASTSSGRRYKNCEDTNKNSTSSRTSSSAKTASITFVLYFVIFVIQLF